MSASTDLLIIIPAFNEGRRIVEIIREVRGVVPRAEILVVDDGSTDRTGEEARRAGAVVLRHHFNLGYGSALQTGYRYALGKGFHFLVQMDGDGQHDPEGIPSLLKAVRKGKIDVAIGSRFLGSCLYPIPAVRRIGMVIFARIATLLTGQEVTDPTSGFQALSRRAFELFASRHFPVDYPDADVIVMLKRAGLNFNEIPVIMRPAPPGKSMHTGILRPLYYIFKMSLSLFVTMLRKP